MLAIFGPTAIGKTAVAIALAERLRERGEDPVAVSADALQVYAELPILTGAATAEEQARLEHRLVGIARVTDTFSVGAYAKLAHREIDAALQAGRRPIVLGGTGLYLRAALADLDLRPPVRRDDGDAAELHARLAEAAPAHAAAVHPADEKRLRRLVALLEAGEELPPPPGTPSRLWTEDTRHPTLLVGLTMERDALRARIEKRVDAMVAAGAVGEVRRAHEAGAARTARAALGFEQLLAGDIEGMKAATQRYAKRQLTWMRKLPNVHLVDATDRAPDDVAAEIAAKLVE